LFNLNNYYIIIKSDFDDQKFLGLFEPFGEIVSSKLMIDDKTGDNLGYGFVRYATPTAAQQAIVNMNGFMIGNKILLVKYSSMPKGHKDVIKNRNLYVKPLLPHTTENQLCELFSVFGMIEDVKVMYDRPTKISRQVYILFLLLFL
jgi:RNA recognition motif-containing protein